jgi:hypothetical protein
MLKVTFNPANKPASADINTVSTAIVNFLEANGIDRGNASSFVKVKDNRTIGFQINCANSNYTTAIGLLLVMIGRASSAYVSFDTHNPDGYQMILNIKTYTNDPYNTLCDWISQHTKVEVSH